MQPTAASRDLDASRIGRITWELDKISMGCVNRDLARIKFMSNGSGA